MKLKIITVSIIAGLLMNCSMQRLTLRVISPVIDNSLTALFEESDLIIAQSAIEADLKLLEGLLKSDPENQKLLFYATQGYTSYALGFVEDEDPDRARLHYLRGRNYGLRILNQHRPFQQAFKGDLDQFSLALKKLKKSDVPALFWTANAWGNWINISMTDPDALADLPKVQAMMQRVIELEPGYFYGGAYLFLGTILMVKPPIMGGNPDEAQVQFDKCFEYSQQKFLLPYVFFARYFAAKMLDEALFDSLIQQILGTSLDVLPEQRLPNAIAQKKARLLLEKREELF
ncbi:TRAP transporter TatT component family protein [candidate division KSB1 bacterium]|nr:TRAP transporter TatT component family protein [candidate division KSB1 bacterium]